MKLFFSKMARCISVRAAIWLALVAAPAGTLVAQTTTAQTPTAKIVTAANTFLATLDTKQRQSTLFAFDDAQQRMRWSNFPIVMVPRAGIALQELTPAQRNAAMALVSAALSKRGLEKVEQIMQGDELLKTEQAVQLNDGSQRPRGPGGPRPARGNALPPANTVLPLPPSGLSPAMFGKGLYFLTILGTPSAKTPWMIQFGGHHLALNITIDGAQGILTPTLTGAQPAMYTLNGMTIRPLGQESDKALALLSALDEGQRKTAILSSRMADLVLGPGEDGKKLQPEGLKATAMNDHQRAMLLDVISEWAGIIHPSAAAARMAQLKADLNETWFSWSGPTTAEPGKNITAYYRIQGPHLVIEYAPQTLGGDPALHVHTMYRDPTNDYGEAFTKK